MVVVHFSCYLMAGAERQQPDLHLNVPPGDQLHLLQDPIRSNRVVHQQPGQTSCPGRGPPPSLTGPTGKRKAVVVDLRRKRKKRRRCSC